MSASNGERARRFHELTKHSPESVSLDRHSLDWRNQPLPFKIYRGVDTTPLPAVGGPEGVDAFEALLPAASPPRDRGLDEAELSRLLFHAAGITKRIDYGGGREMLFRAAACTGALYHIELYWIGANGVYHYDPRAHAADALRTGDWRGFLVEAAGGNPHAARAEVVLALTTTFWRNAWKYQSRAYRHAFWDGGTVLSHVLAMARRLAVPAHAVPLFADADVEKLLGLDADEEGVVTLVALGTSDAPPAAAPSPGTPPEIHFSTEPLSPSPIAYPLVVETHAATSLPKAGEARRLQEQPPLGRPRVRKIVGAAASEEPLEAVIRRRGSSRQFARRPIARDVLMEILEAATLDAMLGDFYVIVNDVDGLEAGAYVHGDNGLTSLRAGDFRREAGTLDLGQPLAADAAVNVYVLTSLDPVLERYGDRGYRIAALEGGLLGGRLYLAAYARKLGATGLTFFDDAVIDFFSPHAAGKSAMFLVAIGVPVKRPKR